MAYKQIIKKALCVVLSVCLFSCVLNSMRVGDMVNATSLAENQNKQSELKQKNSRLNDELSQLKDNVAEQERYKDTLDQQIEVVQDQVDEINALIVDLDNKISQKESEITETQLKIDKNRELLKQRLRAIYMAGETSTLDIILGAKDFNDFLDKAEIIKNVSLHDSKLIEDLKSDMEKIEKEKNELESSRAEVSAQRDELDSKRTELTYLAEESERVLAQLGQETQKITDMIDENDEEIQRINREIEEYYRNYDPTPVPGPSYGTGNYTWPVPGFTYISSDYYDTDGRSSMHGAIDIAGIGIYGAQVVAADSGTVITGSVGGWGGGYGTYLVIDHGNGKSTLYAHMSGAAVSIGQSVSKGQVIGFVGSTGYSTGPHLHFETRLNGYKYNPMDEF